MIQTIAIVQDSDYEIALEYEEKSNDKIRILLLDKTAKKIICSLNTEEIYNALLRKKRNKDK